jgi:hypothetical protein
MAITIQHCNQEAHRLWLQLPGGKNALSTRKKFSLIQNALDGVNLATDIHTVRIKRKLKEGRIIYRYRYETIINYDIKFCSSTRNSCKMYIFKLYIKHCPSCPSHLKQLVNLSKIN